MNGFSHPIHTTHTFPIPGRITVQAMGTTPPAMSKADLAVLEALASRAGTVVGRTALRRLAGLWDHSARRCDASIGAIRRVLGDDAVVTVRSRGWMLRAEWLEEAVQLIETQSRDNAERHRK